MDDEKPTNIFQFPGMGSDVVADLGSPNFRPGAFLDENAQNVFKAIEGLKDRPLRDMLHQFRQHHAMTGCMVDLLEAEMMKRDGQ